MNNNHIKSLNKKALQKWLANYHKLITRLLKNNIMMMRINN